jgi:pimeloyl-ACP methyl ester carboxylesterase
MQQGQALQIDIGHMTLAAKAWGDPALPPMLAVHGWLDNAASFDYLAPLLDSHYVVAIDLPGHGLSDHLPDGMSYQLLDGVAHLVKTLDALDWQRAVIMGHSLGGALGTLLASANPDRVSHLILLDALGPLSEEVAKGPQRLGRAVAKMASGNPKERSYYQNRELMVAHRAMVGGISEEAARLLVGRGSELTEKGYQWRFDPRLLLPSLLYLSEEQVRVFLREIKSPTLFIQGSEGILTDNPLLDARIAEVYGIVHTCVEGHHHCHIDSHQAVAQAIRDFW